MILLFNPVSIAEPRKRITDISSQSTKLSIRKKTKN